MIAAEVATPKAKAETLEEFIVVLRALDCRWYDSKERGIRTRDLRKIGTKYDPHICPITGVCYYLTGKYYSEGRWRIAAENIGLSPAVANTVRLAADNNCAGDSYIAGVRHILLEACGLT